MNKNLLNAVAVSIALHASTLGVARGALLAHGLMPVEELKRLQEKQSAMSFTFVDSPAMQLKDETPARKTNLISDKSTIAKDRYNGPSPAATETPHVDKIGGGKQVGRLAGMPEPPLKVPEQQPQPKSQAPKPDKSKVMKAEKVEESQDTGPKDEERIKQEYMTKIKELQAKIDRAQKKIQENEEILRKQQKTQQEEDDFLRDMEQKEKEQKQNTPSTRGKVGLGGASLHQTASDVQGDVDRFGEFSFNANRYELGEYFKKLKTKVEEYWLPYLAFTYSGNSLFGNKTVVFFKIMPDGTVKGAKILDHSGDELLKDFCLSAVQATSPFDPLPEAFVKNSGYPYLPIVFTFNY